MVTFAGDNRAITCEEAQLLIVPIWLNDPDVTDRQRAVFESHLLACSTCAKEYSEAQRLLPLIIKHWGPISQGTRKLLEEAAIRFPGRKRPRRVARCP